jgi:beta-lactamase class A
MKQILGDPGLITSSSKASWPRTRTRASSASPAWQDFHADSALIEHAGHRYIAVVRSRSPDGGDG